MPALSCAQEAAENENKESSINLQLLVFRRKFHCAWEARQSYRCPATLSVHTGWQTFSQLMMKAGCSISIHVEQQTGLLFEEKKATAVLSKRSCAFKNMMIQS